MSVDVWQWSAIVILSVVLAGVALFLVAVLRSYADLVRVLHDAGIRVEGAPSAQHQSTPPLADRPLAAGVRAFAATTVGGATRAVTLTGGAGPLLVAFLSSGCGTCVDYWRVLRGEGGRIPGIDAPVLVVTKGADREEPARLAELAGSVEVLMSDEAWAGFDVPLTPHFVLLDRADGTVLGEGSAPDPEALSALLGRAVADARRLTRRDFLGGGT